jgi:hypothetical protein
MLSNYGAANAPVTPGYSSRKLVATTAMSPLGLSRELDRDVTAFVHPMRRTGRRQHLDAERIRQVERGGACCCPVEQPMKRSLTWISRSQLWLSPGLRHPQECGVY